MIEVEAAPAPAARTFWYAAALAAALAPYVAVAAYIHPTADDFGYALDTRAEGYWAAQRHQWVTWNGRFASNLLVLANPMVGGSIAIYRLAAVAMIAATIAASYLLVRAISRAALDRRESLLCSLALTGVYLAGLPSLGESIYWFTGAVTYQLSSVLVMIQIALFLRAASTAMVALAAALLIFVAGMNEVAMVVAVAFYGAYAAWMRQRGEWRTARLAAVFAAVAAAAGLAVWLSPGNAIRSAQFSTQHQLVRSSAMTAMQTVRFGFEWAAGGPLLIATLLFIPLARRIADAVPEWRSITRAQCAALAAAPLAVIPAGIFPPYWATGVLGQHRTVGVAYSAFVILWFVAVIALEARGVWPIAADRIMPPLTGALLVALAGSIAFSGNGYTVIADFATRRLQRFDAAMSERYRAFDRCRADQVEPCAVAPLSAPPASLYILDVSDDPAHWVNDGYARYFGVAQVTR